jgi:hypothetical protein
VVLRKRSRDLTAFGVPFWRLSRKWIEVLRLESGSLIGTEDNWGLVDELATVASVVDAEPGERPDWVVALDGQRAGKIGEHVEHVTDARA